MKEYEYIYFGIENLLIDNLVCAICQENLENRTIEGAFQQLFRFYNELRKSYLEKKDLFENLDSCEKAYTEFEKYCIEQRNEILNSFLIDIRNNYPDLDVDSIVKKYNEEIESEDVLSTDKRVCVYPYIMSKIRRYEEEVIRNDS